MKIISCEQGTPAWFTARKGRMTASHAQAISANGKGLDTYILDLMSEFYSSGEKEFYSNADIDRGNELEPIAREMYELERGVKVVEVGFIELDEFVGCSPDGLVGEDGLIEIKSVNDKNHFKLLLDGVKGIESKYMWQMQMQLYVSERKWCDYISYNPNFKDALIIHRIELDEAKIEKLIVGLAAGKAKIKDIHKLIN